MKDLKTIQSFWKQVNIGAPDSCWEWTGYKVQNTGYGQSQRVLNGKKIVGAHRFALVLSTGVCHDRLCALHSCDNRLCCNPSHLRWGTHKENTKDIMMRCEGRLESLRKGARDLAAKSKGKPCLKNRKLTPKQVEEIKTLRREGLSFSRISKSYGVSQQTIANAVYGNSYKELS